MSRRGKGAGWGAALAQAGEEFRRLNPQAFAAGNFPTVAGERRQAVKRAKPPALPIEPPNLPWRFTILGNPATKNTGKSPRPGLVVPSKAHSRWFRDARKQVPVIRAQEGVTGVCSAPIEVTAVWYRRRNVGDEDRYKVALGDFLQRAGFVVNDSLIHWGGGCRRDIDRTNPRTEVVIQLPAPSSTTGPSTE